MPDSTIVPPPRRQRSFSPASPQTKHSQKPDRNTHQHQQHRPHLFHQAPLSPPASTSPSNVDASASPSPQVSNLTPLSAPMSAELSQQSFIHTASQEESQLNIESLPSTIRASSVSDSVLDTSQAQPPDGINRPEKHKLDVVEIEHIDEGHESNKRRRTNHDREENQEELVFSPSAIANSNFQDQWQSFYKILNKSYQISRPHPSQNLFALYGLDDVAASVARNDPLTGEKINKLRKSYEGKVKELAGRNKAVNKPGELLGLVHYPDEEWQIQKVMGKEISNDFSDEFLARLSSATKLGPGKLPAEDDTRWRSSLGLDDTSWKTTTNSAPIQQPHLDKAGAGQNSTSPPTAVGELVRPKRRGTKRRYDDDSFEGYGEGYIDDGGDVVYNEGEGESRANPGIRRKRRKDSASASASFSGPSGSSGGGGGGGGGPTMAIGGFRPSSPQKQSPSASLSVGIGSYGGR